MNPVEKHLFATEFAGLTGASLEGTVVVADEAVNLALQDLLRLALGNTPAPAAPPQKTTAPPPPPAALLNRLEVKQLSWRTEKGRGSLEISAKIG